MQTRYWLAQSGADLPLAELAATAKAHWRIELDYGELKEELGLDHFEGRSWQGWHHHVALVTAAFTFLREEQRRRGRSAKKVCPCPHLPLVRKLLQAALIRLSGRCPWCRSRFDHQKST